MCVVQDHGAIPPLRYQILAIVMIPALLSLVLLTVILRDSRHRWVVEHWTRDHAALVSVLRDRIDDDILRARRLIELVAATPSFRRCPRLNVSTQRSRVFRRRLNEASGRFWSFCACRGVFRWRSF